MGDSNDFPMDEGTAGQNNRAARTASDLPIEAEGTDWFLVYLAFPELADQPLIDVMRAVATEQPAHKIREELLRLLVAAGHPDPARYLDQVIQHFTQHGVTPRPD